jgi:hypothetical protein
MDRVWNAPSDTSQAGLVAVVLESGAALKDVSYRQHRL